MKEEFGMSKTVKQTCFIVVICLLIVLAFAPPVFAAGEVAGAIEDTWKAAAEQIKTVTNNVIFPVVDCVLAIMLFVKLATSYFDYKKHGEFEFGGPAVLFFGLIFSLTAPLYIWNIIGI